MDINEQLQTLVLRDYKTLEGTADNPYEDLLLIAAKIYGTPLSGVRLKDQNHIRGEAGKSIPVEAIRFFAGAPLMTSEGIFLGSLFVIDVEPRIEARQNLDALEALARQVVLQWESRQIKNTREKDLKLLHHSKLASLGEMVASIAHEINNPLAIINGNVGLLRRAVGNEGSCITKTRRYIDSIENTVRRIDKIIRGLKTLCRGGVREPFERVDLRDCITTALSMVAKNFRAHGIEIRHSYRHCEAYSECRSFQIEQILVNLLSNSFDAIKCHSERWVDINISHQGSKWALSVTDSGAGIPLALRDKIMVAFFTTKEGDQGTGLGLSISKSLAEEHGGSLVLDVSSPKTRFVLTLPKTQ